VLSDEALIAAVIAGHAHHADQIHDRLIGVIERTIYRVFGRREADHDDLVQTAFEQIVLTLMHKRFAGACSLATWASTVTAHVSWKALRSRGRERRVLQRDAHDRAPAPERPSALDVEREYDVQRQLKVVRAELADMDPKKAETVFLHDVLGHELAEIAVLTNTSVAAAQSRLVRGRRELFERVERHQRQHGGGSAHED